MASELDDLGISWTDEVFVREEVAAAVASRSCPEAIAEEKKIKDAWTALQAAETKLADLESKAEDDANTMSAAKKEFLLQQQCNEVDRKARELEAAQRAAEVGKRDRQRKELERIKVDEKKEVAERKADNAMKEQTAARNTRVAHELDDRLPFPNPGETSQQEPQQPQAQHAHNRPAAAVIVAQQAPGRAPNVNAAHVRGANSTAVDDYRGGDVLPSVNQVAVTGREARGRRRVVDDGDATLFAARQEQQRRTARRRPREDGDADGGDEEEEQEEGDEQEPAEEEFIHFTRECKIKKSIWEKLFDYQQSGVRWLLDLHFKHIGGILGDEMGLGKTIQIAALLSLLSSSNLLKKPVLIVAPLTVLSQWVGELHKWCPELRAVMFHTSGSHTTTRDELIRSVRGTPTVVVTTYAGATQHLELLHSADFEYVILDEGHKICNPSASITIAAKTFLTPHRIILSGSPIQNTLKELWCLFDFVVPGLLGNVYSFVSTFEDPIKASRNPKATALELATAVECAKALRAHIAPYLLRRMKRDVNAMLPAKHERVIRCSLSDTQLQMYVNVVCSPEVQQLLGRTRRIRNEMGRIDRNGRAADGGLVSNFRGYMTEGMSHQAFRVLSELRLVTNHLDLHQLKEDDLADGGTGQKLSFRSNNPVNYDGSGKLGALRKMLVQWKERGHKVLIFSQYRMMLDILENMVEQENYKYIRMDGSTPSKHRGLLIDTFNDDDSVFIALMTTKVGGLGVNLTGADRVVIFDPDWNPVTDEQARERAWRIGQTREVCVYRMITAGTVEEHILHRQLAKNYVTEKVLKDPTLQRFFSITSFTEAFMLGSEYRDRVDTKLVHSVVANTVSVGSEVEDELARETRDAEIAAEEKDAAAAAGGRVQDLAPQDAQADANQEHETALLSSLVDGSNVMNVHQHGGSGGRPSLATGLAAATARVVLRQAVAGAAPAPAAAAAASSATRGRGGGRGRGGRR